LEIDDYELYCVARLRRGLPVRGRLGGGVVDSNRHRRGLATRLCPAQRKRDEQGGYECENDAWFHLSEVSTSALAPSKDCRRVRRSCIDSK
jgi:hypothetical protein